MRTITTIGLDIAKSVFQVHGVDADGNVVVRRQLKRRYVLAFLSDIFLLIDDCCADNHRFAVSYNRQISDVTDRKKPDPIVQI